MRKDIKIVYLVGGPLTERWLSYYCLDDIAMEFDVEFWDCAALLDDPYIVTKSLDRNYVTTIKDWNDYKNQLSRLSKRTLAVIEIGLVGKHYKLQKLLSNRTRKGVIIDFWTYYLWDAIGEKAKREKSVSLKQKLYKQEWIFFIAKACKCRTLVALKELYNTCQIRKRNRKDFEADERCKKLFNLSEMTYKPNHPYTINHPDYEKYLCLRDKKERNDRYVVFVADFYPYHPEIVIADGYDKEKLAEVYYQSLNLFFDKVERQYDCKVVIAEHPSAKWKTNPFNGREIVYYKTAELVRDSIGVCLHMSCAFSFVALFDKPVAILYNEALNANIAMKNYTPMMAKALGRELINTDTIDNAKNIFLPIDRSVKQQFIQTFADADCNKRNAELMKEHFIDIANR